ncbi:MAG: TlpA disulfide reductase family protein [Cyclobacteriaceae bacterium]
MKRTHIFFWLIIMGFSSAVSAQQTASIVSFEELQQRIEASEKPLTVINFWATWCAPCIKEMPHFEQVFQNDPSNIDLVLVNLDFAEDVEKVNNFIKKKDLKGDVLLLDNLDYNSWIDKIHPSWSGAIPATLFVNTLTDERKFVEGEISEKELEEHLNEVIN